MKFKILKKSQGACARRLSRKGFYTQAMGVDVTGSDLQTRVRFPSPPPVGGVFLFTFLSTIGYLDVEEVYCKFF